MKYDCLHRLLVWLHQQDVIHLFMLSLSPCVAHVLVAYIGLSKNVSSGCTKSLKTPQFSKHREECPRAWKLCWCRTPACSWPTARAQVLQPMGFIDSPARGWWDFPLPGMHFLHQTQTGCMLPRVMQGSSVCTQPSARVHGRAMPPRHLLLLSAGPCFAQSTSGWKCPFL